MKDGTKIQAVILVIFLAIISIILLVDASKTPNDLSFIEGKIKSVQLIKERSFSKSYKKRYRYTYTFQLDTSDQTFGIYVGTQSQASKQADKYTKLLLNKKLAIYYETSTLSTINRNIYLLKAAGKTIIKRNQKTRRNIGIAIAILDFILFILFWLKLKKTKEIKTI